MSASFLLPGLILAMVLITVVSAVLSSWSQKRQARWNASMKGSKMFVPATEFEPGAPVIEEEHIPAPEPEDSTSNFMRNMNERKERQRAHAQKMALKRAHERSAQEAAHRSEMDAIIKRAYASLGKEME